MYKEQKKLYNKTQKNANFVTKKTSLYILKFVLNYK